jgi:hypothetical protein
MLSEMTGEQLGEWMAFYIAEKQLHDEEQERRALEREALAGAEEMHGRMRQ